jgi:hypothetical protein
MKQAGSARVARASSRRSRVGGHANGPEEKLSRSEVGGWRVTGDSESRDRGWGVVSRDIRDHERDAPPATGGGGTLGAHQGLSGPGGGAGAHRRRRCALETELAERVRNCVSRITRICQTESTWFDASSFGATRVPRAADVDRDGVGWSVTVPGVGTRGVPPPGAGVPRVAARPGAPRDRRGACPAVSGVSLLVSSSSEDLVAVPVSASHA